MLTAFAYVRMGTLDKEAKGSSISEQLFRIRSYADRQGWQITKIYQDRSSLYHDENREQFNRMVEDALVQRPAYILVDNWSHFGRTREVSNYLQKVLRKRGIKVVLARENSLNPVTAAKLAEGEFAFIQQEAETSNLVTAQLGMQHNIQKRDPVTGWCYKNGGRAPFGYRIVRLKRGKNSRGKLIHKSVWELHPENAPLVHTIITELYVQQNMSYQAICDYLNANWLKGTLRRTWSASTVADMLRENRLRQYAGTGLWNLTNRKAGETRLRSPQDWIEVEDAHPPIISKEELKRALERKGRAGAKTIMARTSESRYLFTGLNLLGQAMFTCKACGSRVVGYRSSAPGWSKYICAAARSKKSAACTRRFLVDQKWLEDKVISEIYSLFVDPQQLRRLIDKTNGSLREKLQNHEELLKALTTQKERLELELSRLVEAVKAGMGPEVAAKESTKLQALLVEIQSKLHYLDVNRPQNAYIDSEEVLRFYTGFKEKFVTATAQEQRRLIRGFVSHLELNPDMKEVRVYFYPDLRIVTYGVGGGT